MRREQERIRLEQERLRERERVKMEQMEHMEQLKMEEQQRDLGMARLGALGRHTQKFLLLRRT
jgi:hypothetical protein